VPSPVPAWFETDGTTTVTSLTFTGLVPGIPSAWQSVRLYNDQDGTASSDPLLGRRLRALARTGTDPFVASGHAIVDQNAVQIQILGGDYDDAAAGGVVFLGSGSTLPVPSLDSTEYVELRVRVALPVGSSLTDADVGFALDPSAAGSLGDGGALLGRGVRDGLGERSVSEILTAFTISPRGTPSAFVDLSDVVGSVQGRAVVDLEHEQELTNTDGASAALGSGEAYYALFSLGSSGVTVTKGLKATTPLDATDEPTLPDGHKRLGIVVRPFDATIDAGDIVVNASPIGFAYLGASGRNVSFSGGTAAVGSMLVYVAGSLTIEITASTTKIVYLLGDGSLTIAPSAGQDALPLYQFTADGSSITSSLDLRQFAHGGAVRELSAFLPAATGSEKVYLALPAGPDLSIHPLRAIVASLAESDPSSLGATSGSWVLEVKYRAVGGASYSTIFPSSGTDDRRPSLLESVTDPEFSAALPEVTTFEGSSMLELSWSSIPSGGTPSAGAAVRIRLVEVV